MARKYIDVDKVKAEIERRKELLGNGTGHPEVMKRVEGVIKAYDSILAFLDTHPEQPVEGLEEEVKKYWNAHALDYRIGRVADLDFIFLCARHFYELGCRRAAEMYDDIEYNRQMAEEKQPVVGLEEELKRYINSDEYINTRENGTLLIARHFAEWGAEHLKR